MAITRRPLIGKLLGAVFGYWLFHWQGAIIGVFLGHLFDNALAQGFGSRVAAQQHFVSSLFAVMGHVAKADGRVSESEIQLARVLMQRLNLNPAQTQAAMLAYNQGKKPEFKLESALHSLRFSCSRFPALRRMFLELQLSSAFADGKPHPEALVILRKVAALLGASALEFQQLLTAFQLRAQFYQQGYAGEAKDPSQLFNQKLTAAYATLNLTQSASFAEIKTAYRKLMNQYHPDKLISKGLPESMIKSATEKVQEIKEAYELLAKHLGERA